MVDVGNIFVALIVNAEDSGTVETPIGFAGDLYLLVHCQRGEAIVEGLYWVGKPVKKVTEKFMRAR